MKILKKFRFLLCAFLIAICLFSYKDYLFAAQEGTFWRYNPLIDNWEQIQPPLSEEVIHSGNISIQPFDFFSDSSYHKFLDDTHPFFSAYIPEDIVPIHSDFTFNAAARFSLRAEAAEQFADMAWSFAYAFDFKAKLSITSAYRSPSFQKRLAANCSNSRCALPGTSEHEAGLALDL